MANTATSDPAKTSRWSRFILPVGWMAAIFLISAQETVPSPPGMPGFDKMAHFGAYGLLATLWARALQRPGRPWWTAFLALCIASIYGGTDEFHQHFTPGRSVEFADWLADTLGAGVAAGAYCFWPAYRSLLDFRWGRRSASGGVGSASVAARNLET